MVSIQNSTLYPPLYAAVTVNWVDTTHPTVTFTTNTSRNNAYLRVRMFSGVGR